MSHVPGKVAQLVILGRKTVSCASSVLHPHLDIIDLLLEFPQITPFCVCWLLSPGPGLIRQEHSGDGMVG